MLPALGKPSLADAIFIKAVTRGLASAIKCLIDSCQLSSTCSIDLLLKSTGSGFVCAALAAFSQLSCSDVRSDLFWPLGCYGNCSPVDNLWDDHVVIVEVAARPG